MSLASGVALQAVLWDSLQVRFPYQTVVLVSINALAGQCSLSCRLEPLFEILSKQSLNLEKFQAKLRSEVLTLDGWCDDIVRHVVYRQPVMGVADSDVCSSGYISKKPMTRLRHQRLRFSSFASSY